jgi:F-type H+-transporting ATPase subunit delta
MLTGRQIRREATRLFRLCLVNDVLDEQRARQVVSEYAAAKPRGCIAVLSLFRRLVRLDAERHNASIQSVLALPAEVQSAVTAGLSRHYGPGLHTTFSTNPALIAGVRIRVGSDVYDDTVQARLKALERRFDTNGNSSN